MSNNSELPLPSRLLTPKEAAKITGYSEHTLAVKRMLGDGIPFVKMGAKVMYHPSDIDAYIAKNRRTSTSQD